MSNNKRPALGLVTVTTTKDNGTVKPECHGGSRYRINDYSASCQCFDCEAHRDNGNRGRSPQCEASTPRETAYGEILGFWEWLGWARYRAGGEGGGRRWEARDVLSGGTKFLPFAGQGTADSDQFVVFSHIIAAENGGAACACGLLPERGDQNTLRSSRDMDPNTMPAEVLDGLALWPEYWLERHASKPARKRVERLRAAGVQA